MWVPFGFCCGSRRPPTSLEAKAEAAIVTLEKQKRALKDSMVRYETHSFTLRREAVELKAADRVNEALLKVREYKGAQENCAYLRREWENIDKKITQIRRVLAVDQALAFNEDAMPLLRDLNVELTEVPSEDEEDGGAASRPAPLSDKQRFQLVASNLREFEKTLETVNTNHAGLHDDNSEANVAADRDLHLLWEWENGKNPEVVSEPVEQSPQALLMNSDNETM